MPRRKNGTWEDAQGNTIYVTDPNDARYKGQPGYTFVGGRWTYNGQPLPENRDLPSGKNATWPDGTPVTQAQKDEINKQANGAAPSPGAPNYAIQGFADPSGATDNWLKDDAPGATVNTQQADADRERMAGYLAQLQNQAETGNGSWQNQLATATQQGVDAASALGQSATGIDPLAQARNVANSQAAVNQRAAGEAVTMRAQAQQDAQQQLANVYSAQGATDAQQAADQAAARQGQREANAAITEQANKTNMGIYSGAAQGVMALLSKGGPVPGQPEVFGDDEANDTVPAMLSPGEIVLPRSVTLSSNPDDAAAAFVRAVKEQHSGHFDDGGKVPPPPSWSSTASGQTPWATKPDTNASDALPVLAHDSSVTNKQPGVLDALGISNPQQAAGVRNGGLLDTTAYDANRTAALDNSTAFLRAYAGQGPSVAPQMMRASADQTIADALAAQAGARGGGRGAVAGATSAGAARDLAGAAGKTADMVGGEASSAGKNYAAALQRQRQADLAFAVAQQQAAWRNSMLNSGIGLAQQATIRGILGGVGQAAAAGAGALGKGEWGSDSASSDPWAQDATASAPGDYSGGSDSGGSDFGGGSPSFDSGPAYAAHGGLIRRYADGGDVSPLDAGTELSKPTSGYLTAPDDAPPVDPPPAVLPQAPVAPPVGPPRVPAAAPRAPAAPTAPPKPDTYALEQGAVEQEASINEELGRARAEAALGAQKALEESGRQQREQHARARVQADADMARINEARQAMANTDVSVDPGRWWASRSTPGKIAAAIGLALGAIGAGRDGVNRAAGIIENSIARDLEAQKAEHEFKLRKGQAGVESAQSLYTAHRQLAQDDIAANDASRASALEMAKAQVDVATARASSPMAKAQGQMLSAQLAQKRDEHDAATKQRAFENYLRSEDMKTRRIAALKETGNQAEKSFVAPGYKLMPGAAPKVEELAKWREGLAEVNNTKSGIRELKKLIDAGIDIRSPEAAKAEAIVSKLKVGYKNIAALGALSGQDYQLIDNVIPDPTTLGNRAFKSKKALISKLDQYAHDLDRDFHNTSQTKGIVRDDSPQGGGGPQTATGKNGERVRLSADGTKWEPIQ